MVVKNSDALIEDIKQAEDHIHFQYYIYRSDALGEEVRDALTEAAKTRGKKSESFLMHGVPIKLLPAFFRI